MEISPSDLLIRKGSLEDFEILLSLYKETANSSADKFPFGVEEDQVKSLLEKCVDKGIMILLEHKQSNLLIGEIHAYKPKGKALTHVFSEFGFIVHPKAHGKNIGPILMDVFLNLVRKQFQDVLRLEVMVRESNTKALTFYESFAFKREGVLERRFRRPDGIYESDIPMVWFNPDFKE